MKKFNLVKEIISVNKPDFMAAINAHDEFGITIEGALHYAPFDETARYVYQGRVPPPSTSPMLQAAKTKTLAELLGGNLQVVDVDDRILIKAARNWKEIMRYNLPNADYDDTTGDGVDEFKDKALETIGWHAAEFGVTYRELVDLIETSCDGTLLCIETESETNYQFSGMGFIDDIECARSRCFEHVKKRIETVLREDGSYTRENLTDDERDAMAFFGIDLSIIN